MPDFILEHAAPLIHNQPIADAQGWMQVKLASMPGDLHEEPGAAD